LSDPGEAAGATPVAGLDAEAVAAYLAGNPDFLAGRPDLLRALTPVDARRGEVVADFQRHVARRLQSELARVSDGHAAFAAASRAALAAQGRVHRAVLALLGARTLDRLVEAATVDLALELEADAAVLGLEADPQAPFALRADGLRVWPRGRVEAWLPNARAALLGAIPSGTADPLLFGSAAPLVRSQALLRLDTGPGRPPGLLALGARDAARFQGGGGTDLLLFLARALALCLAARFER
jgi:uncharacterized protein YigA (DUF484 family)